MQKECEVCLELNKHSQANRELYGVWMCVDCIVELNKTEAREGFKVFDRTSQTLVTKTPAAAPSPGIIVKAPIQNAQALVTTLSTVMEKMLAGELEPEKAIAICKVSSEAVKVMDLIWRMSR